MVKYNEVDRGGCSSCDKIAPSLTSMLRTISATRSSANLTPPAVVVKDDEDMVVELVVVVKFFFGRCYGNEENLKWP